MKVRRTRAALSTLLTLMLVAGMTLSGLCGKPVPPDRPTIIAGPNQGSINISYEFTARAISPEGDSVAIRFDWGDGDTSDWSGYVASGDSVTMSHAWAGPGEYPVRAQAQDRRGAESDWSEPHQVTIAGEPAIIKWRFETEGPVLLSPAVGLDGTIYASAAANGHDHLYAINPDGTLKWKYRTGAWITTSPAIADDGTVYFGASNSLYALNPDGTLKWQYQTGGEIWWSSPAIAADGTIYLGSSDSCLHALNPDGSRKWRYRADDRVSSSPTIGLDGTVYVRSREGYLHALSPDGSLKWRYRTEGSSFFAPSIGADGTLYVTDWHNLYALNPDGTLKWRCNVPALSSAAIGADGTIYVSGRSSDDSRLSAISAISPNGMLKWQYAVKYRFMPIVDLYYSSPAIAADGTVYIGLEDGHLHALNPDGAVLWRHHPNSFMSSPAIAPDGTVYIGAGGHGLYAIEGDAPLADSPWPKYQRDNRNTGRVRRP